MCLCSAWYDSVESVHDCRHVLQVRVERISMLSEYV